MGLFGDKAMKALDQKLESGWMAFELTTKLGNAEVVVNNVGDELLAAANKLRSEGRTAEAVAKLSAAHRAEGDAEASVVTNWNGLLDQVAAHLT